MVGTPETGSDIPVPSLSKITRREKAATLSKNDLTAGWPQKNSMWETKEGTRTMFVSPSPTIW
jgi:hypothetical protein